MQRDTSGGELSTNIVGASWIITSEDDRLELLRDHELVIEGGVIQEIRPIGKRGNDRATWLEGELLSPGFISGHSHAGAGTATRGYIECNPRLLSQGTPRPGRHFLRAMEFMEDLPEDELDALTSANVLEMLRSGCTTHVEMSLSLNQMQSYMRVAQKYGVRERIVIPRHCLSLLKQRSTTLRPL